MENSESRNECIKAIVRKYDEPKIMSFPINASTNIKFGGERYVHAWMNFQFSNSLNSSLKIIARARQFSSFILLLGTVTSATEFTPKQAIMIENKDDILIPLLTEVIPTPKAFKKAVDVFGKGNSYCNFVGGLESIDSMAEGFDYLASIGIAPSINVFHPDPKSKLNKKAPPSIDYLLKMGQLQASIYKKNKFIPIYPVGGTRNSLDTEAWRGLFD